MNTKGEDIVWVDYAAAVSMHRVRANVPSEQRLERLASPTIDDNRISFGCINLPPEFYDKTLKAHSEGRTNRYLRPARKPPPGQDLRFVLRRRRAPEAGARGDCTAKRHRLTSTHGLH
jgi:hypothetical protein